MRSRALGALLRLLPLLLLAACATAPFTHRSQLIILPESQETQLGADAYRQILSKEALIRDPKVVNVVRDVGERIAKAANKPDYKWEFAVIDDDSQINAFALPGGKVAVYTGLFPVAHDTAGLAAVLGHEVGHALAHHAAERMSQGVLVDIAAAGLSVALGSQSPYTRDAVMQAFGLGAQVGVLLPFNRSQEAEADHIGLILMAKAGYDPHAALDLWKRFGKTGGTTPPEFLSTHPNYGTRERNIESWLPEAMRYSTRDPSLRVVPLPTLAEMEIGSDAGGAALKRYVRILNDRANQPNGRSIVAQAMSAVYQISGDEVRRRLQDQKVNFGEVGVAGALAQAGAGAYDEIIDGYKHGQSWSALARGNDATARQALTVLREVVVAARRLAQPGAGR